MNCPQLKGILSNWLKPPRKHSRGINTRGARDVLESWALDNVSTRIVSEMNSWKPNFVSPTKNLSEELLLGINLKHDIPKMKTEMPVFWDLMESVARTPRQRKLAKYKDHEPVSICCTYYSIYSRIHSASSWSAVSYSTIVRRPAASISSSSASISGRAVSEARQETQRTSSVSL